MTWLPPDTHGTGDGWHVFIITPTADGDIIPFEVEVLHPQSCTIEGDNTDGSKVYGCHTAHDLIESGYYGFINRYDDKLEPGVYLAHPWVEEIRGFDYTEYDGGWSVIKLAEATRQYDDSKSSGGMV